MFLDGKRLFIYSPQKTQFNQLSFLIPYFNQNYDNKKPLDNEIKFIIISFMFIFNYKGYYNDF